ncbi:MAG: YceD family protein [Burkholderiaceae bacterium]
MSERPSKAEKIDAFELSRTRGHFEGAVGLSDMTRLAAMLVDTEGELAYSIDGLVDANGHPGALMQVMGAVRMSCNRCGKPVTIEFDREVPFRFVRSEAEANAIPVDEDEDVEIVVGSAAMVVADWVEEEAILSLPIAPRHENCSAPEFDAGEIPREAADPERRRPFSMLETLKRGKAD